MYVYVYIYIHEYMYVHVCVNCKPPTVALDLSLLIFSRT